MKQMALFKKFTEAIKPKASKEELEGFKSRLKYGDDPMAHWKASNEHYEIYRDEKKTVEELLRKILKPRESDKRDNWSKMEINIWSHKGKCEESPIGEHIYLHHYGDKNPLKGTQECLCCEKEL